MEYQDQIEDEDMRDCNGKPKPIDGGRAAWMFVIGTWLLEAFVWGFVLSFGIFQAHYAKQELFRQNEKQIPLIGAVIPGIAHVGFGVVSSVALRWPQYKLPLAWLGWALCILALLLASYATKVMHLLLTQGVLYGIGWVVCYVPILILLNEWWVAKRGLVYGIVYGASGVGGLIFPFLLEASLARFDFRTTLRTSAFVMALCTGPALLLLKPRNTTRIDTVTASPLSNLLNNGVPRSFKSPVFLIFSIAVFLQGISFYLPRFFFPEFAHSIPLSNSDGASLLAIWSLGQVVGQVGMGALADHVSIFIPATLSTGVSALTVFLLWGPAKSFGRLAAFAGIYGGFAGSYSALWSRTTMVLGETKEEATTMFAIFSFERGIANLLEGPISAALLEDAVMKARFGLGRYEGNVWFVGVTMAIASLTFLGWFWRDWLPSAKKRMADEDNGEAIMEMEHLVSSDTES